MAFSRFVIVTGLSGAGKSQAMKTFEDLDFTCLDNLPPVLTRELVRLCEEAGVERLALALDVRTGGPFGDALGALADLGAAGIPYELLFLDASDEALIRRYSETRRRHPFESDVRLPDAIELERRELAGLRAKADRVLDTTDWTHATLKTRLASFFAEGEAEKLLRVHVTSFGFKHGLPLDADLVFDVRFLPNPNYVPHLKELSGKDAAVAAYIRENGSAGEFLARLEPLIDVLLPQYVAEGKSRLTIAIGCTGGRHRSVYIAETLAHHLVDRNNLSLTVEHRDLVEQ